MAMFAGLRAALLVTGIGAILTTSVSLVTLLYGKAIKEVRYCLSLSVTNLETACKKHIPTAGGALMGSRGSLYEPLLSHDAHVIRTHQTAAQAT